MNHNNAQSGQWVAVLAGITLFGGLGIVVGYMGFRVDSGALGNIYGVTPHQWGVLLSGFFGSVAGAAVAVWVLRRTIEHQEANHRLQLQQAEKLHSKQLLQAQRLHSSQLEAQQSEATRERSHAAAAGLLSGLWLLNRASKSTTEDMREQIDSIIQAAHRLRLERQNDELAQALMAMIGELEGCAEVVPGNEAARKELIRITAMVTAAAAVWFQAADGAERNGALASLRRAQQKAAVLVASHS